MLQPSNLSRINDSTFDFPALEKWKNKFDLQTPNSDELYSPTVVWFKGTLYYRPDLSSGVQLRFKVSTWATITAKKQSGEWYYVETYSSNGTYYEGWIASGTITW